MSLPTTSNVTRPLQHGYGARIDDLFLRLQVSKEMPLDIVTAPLQAPAVNTAVSAEELRNDYGQIFSRADFTGGAGLGFAHKRGATDLDATRFWDSKHIDVTNPQPGKPAKITLLAAGETIEAAAGSNLRLAYDGVGLQMSKGSAGDVRRSVDPTVAAPTFADDPTGVSDEVTSLATLGADTYAAVGTSGIRLRHAGVWSSFSSSTTGKVWAAKRQLLCTSGSDGSALAYVTLTGGSAGTHNVLVTLAAGQTWLDVKDCGHAILAAASDGSIYALGFTDASGAAGGILELKAQTVMGGTEVPYALGFDGTFVFYSTREQTPFGAIGRFYRSAFSTTLSNAAATPFTLTGSQLLRRWGDQGTTRDQCPRQIIATRDAVFTGVLEDEGSFLWRYDRATTGVTRHLDLGGVGLVEDILVVSGRLYATVAGVGLCREKVGSFEASGYLIGPLADFFTASKKSWSGALIEHDTIPLGTQIELYYTTDPDALTNPASSSWVLAKHIIAGTDLSETPLVDVNSRYLAAMVKLYSDDTRTSAPSFRSFAFRAYPGEGDTEVTMYVVVSDTIERPGMRRQRARGYGDRLYREIKGREGSYAELELFRPAELFRGVIEQIGTRVPAVSRRGAERDVAAVKFRGRRVVEDELADGTFSVGLFGLMLFGGLEAAA